MAIRQIEGKLDLAGIDSLGGVVRCALDGRAASDVGRSGSGDCGGDQHLSVEHTGNDVSGWTVQPGGGSPESDAPLSEEVMEHLADELVPEEKTILSQLRENTKLSLSGFPVPNKIEITGHVEF